MMTVFPLLKYACLQIDSFLKLLESKDNTCYRKFLTYLEEDYDWVAWSLKNAQISPDLVSELDTSRLSVRSGSEPETVRMSSVERDRDRRQERGSRGQGEAEDDVRDRERLGAEERRLDTSMMSTSGYSGSERGFASPVHSSEFSLRSSHSGDTDRLEY